MIQPYFWNYLPFKEDLTFYLYKLHFPFSYICRMICIKFYLNWLVSSEEGYKDFVQKMIFPIVDPPDPQGQWFVQTWISTISGSFCVNLSFSGFVVLEKIFKWPHCIFVIISLFEEDLALNLHNFKFPLPRVICTKFDWNWLIGSGEDF
jgi:hypothetical protein